MKRFFTFLLNRLFLIGDFFLLFIELNIELVVRFAYFFIETIQNIYQWIRHFWNLKLLRKTPSFSRSFSKPTSFGGQVRKAIIQETTKEALFVLVLYTFPIFGFIGTIVVNWVNDDLKNLIGLVVMSIMWYLPQQRIFRDPVTRFFFEREWFRNYGEAFRFTQFCSFLLFIWLCVNGWLLIF